MRWLPDSEEHLHGSVESPVLEDDGTWAASQIQSNTGQAQNGTQPSSLILRWPCCLYKGLIICPAPKQSASSGQVGESAKIYWEVDSLHCHRDMAKHPILKYGNLLPSFPASSSLLIPKEPLPSLSCPSSKSASLSSLPPFLSPSFSPSYILPTWNTFSLKIT